MALYTGVTGKVEVKNGESDAKTVCMATFNVEMTATIIEKIRFGQPYKEKGSGIKDWTATADGYADFSDGGQKELYDAFGGGHEIVATFYLDENTFLSGTALIESLSISHDAEGKADLSASLSGSGGILLTVPAEPSGTGTEGSGT